MGKLNLPAWEGLLGQSWFYVSCWWVDPLSVCYPSLLLALFISHQGLFVCLLFVHCTFILTFPINWLATCCCSMSCMGQSTHWINRFLAHSYYRLFLHASPSPFPTKIMLCSGLPPPLPTLVFSTPPNLQFHP